MDTLSIVLNDGGRSKSKRKKQNNDCAVVAFAIAAQTSYDDAFDLMQIHGRANNKGVMFNQILSQYPGKIVKYMGYSNKLIHVLPCLMKGRFIVLVNKHTFAVIDGVIHDEYPVDAYGEVFSVWEVKEKITFVDTLFDAL